MHYPQELHIILKSELSSLIEMKRENIGPFSKKSIEMYYEKYQQIAKS